MSAIRRTAATLARPSLFLCALALGALVAGCKGATPIKDILDDPSRFSGKEVSIAGEVSSSAGVLGTGFYRVDDGTGKITVVTKSGGVPREGAKVGVKGQVKSGYTIGTESLVVLLESERYTP
jgi:hypothetical protein